MGAMTLRTNSSPQEILHTTFGYPAFRGNQEAIVDHVIGGGDALVLMPTGGGKSLCFQIPALVYTQEFAKKTWPREDSARPPLTLVLSPLIALMKDQVDALQAKGIEATFVNSSLDRDERNRRYKQIADGHYTLLYVTPERFRKEEFMVGRLNKETVWGFLLPENIGLVLDIEKNTVNFSMSLKIVSVIPARRASV